MYIFRPEIAAHDKKIRRMLGSQNTTNSRRRLAKYGIKRYSPTEIKSYVKNQVEQSGR